MYTYQKTNRYFGQIGHGLEELGCNELEQLGARDAIASHHGVYFSAGQEELYRIVYCSRLFTRILAPLITFDCHSTKYLYKTARGIDWPGLFAVDRTLAVDANVANSKITHSQYAALCLKDAIVDSFRDACGNRPSIDTHWPDVRLNLYIENNKATLSMDVSGGSLHRRGYRQESVEAPMQETVAAAIINLSEWQGETPLFDPMCGSGTLLAEAHMHYCRIPAAGLRSHFGFSLLPDFDDSIWQQIQRNEEKKIRTLPEGLINGSDISKPAVAAARKNLLTLPHSANIKLQVRTFQDITAIENATIICNPPYGIRAQADTDMARFMGTFGSFLKHRCKGTTAYLYFGDTELIKRIGLRPTWKKPLRNGGLDGRLVKYELY